jgi:hypothetical protein
MPDLNEKKSAEELMSKKQSVFANVLNLFSVKMMHDNIFQLRYQNEILLLNNDPQKQLLLVPSKNILLQFINDVNVELKPLGLTLYIGNVFEASEFWDFVKNHKNIMMLKFTIPYPNLGIENAIKSGLKKANSKSTSIKFEADSDSSLNIDMDNELLRRLVECSAQRSLKISVKVKGERDKYLYIGDKIKEICEENYDSLIEILMSK